MDKNKYSPALSRHVILQETIRQVVRSQREELESLEPGIEREALRDVPLDIPFAVILSGIRRCGKSTLLRQLAKELRSYAYLNFEDPRFVGLSPPDFPRLEKALEEEYGPTDHYLLDEVQAMRGWETFVRAELDRGKRFVITGSNASLLGTPLGTKLTGRHLRKELFPFSYAEYLKSRETAPGPRSLKEYLMEGGFPSYLRYHRSEILRELFMDILSRDILAHHPVRGSTNLRELATYLMSNPAKEASLRTLSGLFHLRSQTTASRFVAYLEDSYLLQTIPVYDPSLKRRLRNPRKSYAIDTGLAAANSLSFSEDRGGALENSVFLHLRRSFREIFYFKGKGVCDFVVRDRGKVHSVIQVCYELTETNQERELQGLGEALDRLDIAEGTIVTLDQEDSLCVGNRRAKVVPAWKWMITRGERPSRPDEGTPARTGK